MDCNCWEHRRLGPGPPTQEQVTANMERFVAEMLEEERRCQMGTFNINITGVGGHGCERKAKAGDKLYGRCGRFGCPDCMAHDFVQQMKQRGMFNNTPANATFTHWPGTETEVVDDLLKNERVKGQF